jgi:hypothetical protein
LQLNVSPGVRQINDFPSGTNEGRVGIGSESDVALKRPSIKEAELPGTVAFKDEYLWIGGFVCYP